MNISNFGARQKESFAFVLADITDALEVIFLAGVYKYARVSYRAYFEVEPSSYHENARVTPFFVVRR